MLEPERARRVGVWAAVQRNNDIGPGTGAVSPAPADRTRSGSSDWPSASANPPESTACPDPRRLAREKSSEVRSFEIEQQVDVGERGRKALEAESFVTTNVGPVKNARL